MSNLKNKTHVLIISGPTASGKTDLSLKLGSHFFGEIINADVGQFYSPFSIGTAKPAWKLLSPLHHLFDIIDTPQNLINSLPSNGLVARISIENLSQKLIDSIEKYPSIRKVLRVGNESIEVLMDDFEENLSNFMKYLFDKNYKVVSMSRDVANFRRYFQIRIQEEEKKEMEQNQLELSNNGGSQYQD